MQPGLGPAKKEWYRKKINSYQEKIDAILRREQSVIADDPDDPESVHYKKLLFAEELLYMVTLHLAKYQLLLVYDNSKNKDTLTDIRNALYKTIIYFESIVTNLIDAPFSDYAAQLEKIKQVPQKHRYYLIRKLGLLIDLVNLAYSNDNKWKFVSVEIQGRFAVIAKNILDLKDSTETGLDPKSPEYDITVFHLKLVKALLLQAATRYRQKYEMNTSSVDDFKLAIQYLSALRRIHLVLNERNAAEEVKKRIDIWLTKMEKDMKKRKTK
ncbi:MAG: hypothetical protein ACTTJ7_01665 [Treponema sp.]